MREEYRLANGPSSVIHLYGIINHFLLLGDNLFRRHERALKEY